MNLPDKTRTERGRDAFVIGAAAITGTIIERKATDITVSSAQFDKS